jgi:hypothetical protein
MDISKISDSEWNNIIIQLKAFIESMIEKRSFFRGSSSDSYLKGKEADDYVLETIHMFIENPEKYNPTKGSLIKFLKYYLARNIVGKDFRSKENKVSQEFNEFTIDEDDSSIISYEESVYIAIYEFFEDQLDFKKIVDDLINEIGSDILAENVLFGLINGYKPREVMSEFNMTDNEYNNALRRLKTIQKSIALKNNYSYGQQLKS